MNQKEERGYINLFMKIHADKELTSLDIFATVKDIFREHVEKQPPAYIYQEIATFLLNVGRPELAEKYFLHSLSAARLAATYSLYLQCLLMSPTCSEAKMLRAARKYNKLFLRKIKRYKHKKSAFKDTKLTIGYTCHFFHNAPSQTLLLPYLQAHDRNKFKIICYSDAPSNEVPPAIKNVADVWRDTQDLTDEELASLIKSDQVNILVELNGHCVKNRYAALARKPAPIQASHYNLSATSGVAAIDYILLGQEFTLDQRNYSEKIYYHKGIRKALAFPDYFPPCSNPPFLKNNYITFGSFGATHKINTDVIQVWCQILNRIPNARFFMKAGTLDHAPFLNAYKQLFKNYGCDPERIIFEGYSDHPTMLEKYSQVDIALDTFPYSGATTIREALWQGVPVITLRDSNKYCTQHGNAILSSMGHSELIANSVDEFVNKAVTLANTPDRLVNYRKTLRDDFKSSPLCNLKLWVSHLEEAYLNMWERFKS